MSRPLGLGKVTKKEFNELVLPYLPMLKIPELDGITLDLPGETVLAHSPSIGVPLESLGFFAFHYSASNVAARFGKPLYMVTGIYLPLKTPENDLRIIARSLGDEAKKYDVQIIAGQTATYYGLDIPLITSTCIGSEIRRSVKIDEGDYIVFSREVGGEGVWLNDLSQGKKNEEWRNYTPLPNILAFQNESSVKLMHDISEGGVMGSLIELADSIGMRLNVSTDDIAYHKRIKEIGGDTLRMPSYGSFISIVSHTGLEELLETARDREMKCEQIGTVQRGKGVYIDGKKVDEQKRINIDEIYGSFTRSL